MIQAFKASLFALFSFSSQTEFIREKYFPVSVKKKALKG